MVSIFLSHSYKNRQLARRLAHDLTIYGIFVWLDKAELGIGDSLVRKLESTIETVDYLGVILSQHSLKSEWVRREVELALNHEILGKRVNVLPILQSRCEIPGFLLSKVCADLSTPSKYRRNFKRLLARIQGTDLRDVLLNANSSVPDEAFARKLISPMDAQDKRIYCYFLEWVSGGNARLDHNVRSIGDVIALDLVVPPSVKGSQDGGSQYYGVDISFDKARKLFSVTRENELVLSPTGSLVLDLLKPWSVKDINWYEHFLNRTRPYANE